MLITVLMAVAMYAVWRTREERALQYWVAGMVLIGVGLLLIALRGAIPLWISLPLANALTALGAGCNWAGMDRFFARKPKWIWIAAITAADFAALWYYTFIVPDANMRIVVATLGTALMVLGSAHRVIVAQQASELG